MCILYNTVLESTLSALCVAVRVLESLLTQASWHEYSRRRPAIEWNIPSIGSPQQGWERGYSIRTRLIFNAKLFGFDRRDDFLKWCNTSV